MSELRFHHHHHRQESRLRFFLRTYRFEVIWTIVVALGVFLILERMNIRRTLFGWLRTAAAGALHGAGHLGEVIATFISRTTFSDAVGYALILGALAAILWRLRWRAMRNPSLTQLRCPWCGGSIHRVHRHWIDHLISLYIPVRRYRCTNNQCRWHGRRVGTSHGSTQTTPVSQRPRAGS